MAGVFWEADTPVPDGAPQDGSVAGIATLTDAEFEGGELISGELTVDLEGLGTVVFAGPVTCD